eukprot:c25564_g2_i1 orf=1-261(-)
MIVNLHTNPLGRERSILLNSLYYQPSPFHNSKFIMIESPYYHRKSIVRALSYYYIVHSDHKLGMIFVWRCMQKPTQQRTLPLSLSLS